ncbi:MAG: hypothetical protein R2710_10540 [Acidimicrobiales bacterium]
MSSGSTSAVMPGPATMTSGDLVEHLDEDLVVFPVVGGRVASWHSDRKTRLVEEFEGVDGDPMVGAELQQRPGAVIVPAPVGVARPGVGRKRGQDLSVDGLGELADPDPLVGGEHGVVALGGDTAGCVLGVEIGRVRPGTADPDVHGAEFARQIAQAFGPEIDRLSDDLGRAGVIWRPELSAGHLHHFDVVGSEPGVDRGDQRTVGCERDVGGGAAPSGLRPGSGRGGDIRVVGPVAAVVTAGDARGG